MPLDNKIALVRWLGVHDQCYLGKLDEVATQAQRWLEYVPATYPHYPNHTVEHSEEILRQVSRLLFPAGSDSPTVRDLTAAEAYILSVAAYLHDAGMVASETEKSRILASSEWHAWLDHNSATRERLNEATRLAATAPTNPGSVFRAGLLLRLLLADFIRVHHHLRSCEFLTLKEPELGRFSFDDPALARAVGAVCAAHGRDRRDLEDRVLFPESEDIRGEKVNVRFLAILLRLGDLLDLRYQRACPLLRSAASPLPPESAPHWTQYDRILHRDTRPDVIEIRARCQHPEEHRVLLDWCRWLVEEVENAGTVMRHAVRHGEWRPPRVCLTGNDRTIDIGPAENARYVAHDWRIEADPELLIRRLVGDLHASSLAFVRELLQNALDATRCQMYTDLAREGKALPLSPTRVPEKIRKRYHVEVSLIACDSADGTGGPAQAVVVEDSGIGMDAEAITKYLLQVGRSYYRSAEFAARYPFVPTSRFGVGFLSVFAQSDRVTVETRSSQPSSEAVRLVLTGPQSYLLVEHGTRTGHGTRIEVQLRQPLGLGELTHTIRRWCRRVEFPVIINELGARVTVEAEKPAQFIQERRLPNGTVHRIRAIAATRPGIQGELYVHEVHDRGGTQLAPMFGKTGTLDTRVRPPQSLVCLHGIEVNSMVHTTSLLQHFRVDLRGERWETSLSRDEIDGIKLLDQLEVQWAEIVRDYARRLPRTRSRADCRSKLELRRDYPVESVWRSVEGLIPVCRNGRLAWESIQQVAEHPHLRLAIGMPVPARNWAQIATRLATRRHVAPPRPGRAAVNAWSRDAPVVTHDDCKHALTSVLEIGRHGVKAVLFGQRDNSIILELKRGAEDTSLYSRHPSPLHDTVHLCDLKDPGLLGVDVDGRLQVVNAGHKLVAWHQRILQADLRSLPVERDLLSRTRELFSRAAFSSMYSVRDAVRIVAEWRTLPQLPTPLVPPRVIQAQARLIVLA
jgi:molecular chaperone HtpG